jgi:hypothetical protein
MNRVQLSIAVCVALCCALLYYSPVLATTTVGTGQNIFWVGTAQNIFTVGAYTPPPIAPIEDYFAAKPILLFIPGLLLLGFILMFGFMGFTHIKENEIIVGLSYFMIALLLMGITLMIAMPLIIDGVDATMWFK